jgi:hypothetical protein
MHEQLRSCLSKLLNVSLSDSWRQLLFDNATVYINSQVDLSAVDLADVANARLDHLEARCHCFGLIIVWPTRLRAMTDRYSTVPLYFSWRDHVLSISDVLLHIVRLAPCQPDPVAAFERIVLDYSLGGKTLLRGIPRLGPGQSVEIDLNSEKARQVDVMRYAVPPTICAGSWGDRVNNAADALKGDIEQAVKPYESLLVPLSGGLDSRLAIGTIARHTDKQVCARTYGEGTSLDVRYATGVAKRLGIQHTVTRKSDHDSICEFEQLCVSGCGEISGIHAHDMRGIDVLENSKVQARVTGFIGDFLGRGAKLATHHRGIDEFAEYVALGKSLYNHSFKMFDLTAVPCAANLPAFAAHVQANVAPMLSACEPEDWHWVYYSTVHIYGLTTLIENSTHVSKPNLKVLINGHAWQLIAALSREDKWPGMGYASVAKQLIPELLRIPLASNAIFASPRAECVFRARRCLHRAVSRSLSALGRNRRPMMPFNATRNWGSIIERNREWVSENVDRAAEVFRLDKREVERVVAMQSSGVRGSECLDQLVLRVVSLGVVAKAYFLR